MSTSQLSLAIPLWVGAMSTSQTAVTSCGWGVKAVMVRVWVAGKTVWSYYYTRAISERFRDKGLIIKRYTNLFVLYRWVFVIVRYSAGSETGHGWVWCKYSRLHWLSHRQLHPLSDVGAYRSNKHRNRVSQVTSHCVLFESYTRMRSPCVFVGLRLWLHGQKI